MIIAIPIFDFIGDHIVTLAGGLWTLVGIAATYAAKKYLIPWLTVDRHRKYAAWIASIADEITDELVQKFPEKKWLAELDKAVDRLITICGIDRAIAERAIRAAAVRKQ